MIAGVGIAGLINAAMTIGGVEEGPFKAGCGHPSLDTAFAEKEIKRKKKKQREGRRRSANDKKAKKRA